MLTEETVAAAYQLLLGRPPESESVVRNFVENTSFDGLRDAIIGSAEFADRVAGSPGLLDLHPWAMAGCPRMRLGCRQLEHLASLDLPLWGRTVLCPQGESGQHPSFFADRLCKVVVPTTNPETVFETQARLRRLRRHDRADPIDVRCLDLCAHTEFEAGHLWQIVSIHEVTLSPRKLSRFVTNVSSICSEMLILDLRVCFDQGDSIAVAREAIGGGTMEFAVPSRLWMQRRLAHEFPHVYVPRTQPCHGDYALDWTGGTFKVPWSRAIFVASRHPLDERKLSPDLLESQVTHLNGAGRAS